MRGISSRPAGRPKASALPLPLSLLVSHNTRAVVSSQNQVNLRRANGSEAQIRVLNGLGSALLEWPAARIGSSIVVRGGEREEGTK